MKPQHAQYRSLLACLLAGVSLWTTPPGGNRRSTATLRTTDLLPEDAGRGALCELAHC